MGTRRVVMRRARRRATAGPRAWRLLGPLLLLAAGAGAGLYVGWVAYPLRGQPSSPAALHQVYKDDYVLMLAAAYAAGGDLEAVRAQFVALGFADPAQAVTEAAGRLRLAGLAPDDEARLEALAEALRGE